MKRFVWILMLALVLCGCGTRETMETIADEPVLPAMAQPREISVELPGEAALPAMESSAGRAYLGKDYEIYIQTLAAGDLDATVRVLSGYSREGVTLVETSQGDMKRYEFVWTSAGETGDRLGRAVVLDDGDYHYALSILRDEGTTATSQIVWNDIFASFGLG